METSQVATSTGKTATIPTAVENETIRGNVEIEAADESDLNVEIEDIDEAPTKVDDELLRELLCYFPKHRLGVYAAEVSGFY